MAGTARRTELIAASLAAAALALGGCNEASPDETISVEEAEEIEEALDDVEDGYPNRYEEDGDVFRNDEMLLPDHQRGYYREYTVETGDDDRGERRVVIGQAGEAFYTEDHYESFIPIEPADYSARLP